MSYAPTHKLSIERNPQWDFQVMTTISIALNRRSDLLRRINIAVTMSQEARHHRCLPHATGRFGSTTMLTIWSNNYGNLQSNRHSLRSRVRSTILVRRPPAAIPATALLDVTCTLSSNIPSSAIRSRHTNWDGNVLIGLTLPKRMPPTPQRTHLQHRAAQVLR